MPSFKSDYFMTPPGKLQFGSSSYSVNEDGASVTVVVQRVNGSYGAIGVNYQTTSGTAVAGVDFTSTSGSLSWASGDTSSKNIIVPILDDSVADQGDHNFTVGITNPSGGATILSGTVTISIADNDVYTQKTGVKVSSSASVNPVDDGFGYQCAISSDGTTMVASAAYEDGGIGNPISDCGCATVFTKSGGIWVEQQILRASDAQVYSMFGSFIAINSDGSVIVVTTGYARGCAYVFTKSGSTWSQQQILKPGSALCHHSVDITPDGSTIVIGVLGDTACYVFSKSGSTWSKTQDIIRADLGHFGVSVSIDASGTLLVVGAQVAQSAVVYTKSGGTFIQQQVLTASNGEGTDMFGIGVRVSADGSTIAVSSYHESGVGNANPNAGAVYMFTKSGATWVERQILRASNTATDDVFGQSLCITTDGAVVYISAIGKDTCHGSVYAFKKSGVTWSEVQIIRPAFIAAYHGFGRGISCNSTGSVCVVGTPGVTGDANANYVVILT